jgi:hypothetical protein
MKYCEKDFIDQIGKMLSLRKRRVISHPPFSHAAVLVPLFKKNGDSSSPRDLKRLNITEAKSLFLEGLWMKRIGN